MRAESPRSVPPLTWCHYPTGLFPWKEGKLWTGGIEEDLVDKSRLNSAGRL